MGSGSGSRVHPAGLRRGSHGVLGTAEITAAWRRRGGGWLSQWAWEPAARLRTDAAKRFRLVKNATAVIWKMLLVAEQTFRRVKHPELMPVVYRGGTFVDGMLVNKEVAA